MRKSERSDVEQAIREFIGGGGYPCIMARSVLNCESYRIGRYHGLGTDAAPALAADLQAFLAEAEPERGYRSFLAVFDSPRMMSEEEFETRLWRTLQALHHIDAQQNDWDRSVSDDPADPRFSFSFGEQAFYIIGMHPGASRIARRFAWPMLVFNLHRQFEQLRASGRYDSVRDTIRTRDRALQGSMNPMTEDFGTASEARQYSGRHVGPEWKCPFHRAMHK